MKIDKAKDVRPDVLERLTLPARTDAELFALLSIMEKQQKCFAAMAWRRLSKSLWTAMAPVRYRAGWLCAAVSGMLFITATSVAYNQYSINSDLQNQVNALQPRMDPATSGAIRLRSVKTTDALDGSCIPVRMDGGEYILLRAPRSLEKKGTAKLDAMEKLKQLAIGCISTDIGVRRVAQLETP